jgi:6-phosphogluconolactonase
MELLVYDTAEEVAIGAASRIADLVGDATERFTLGLAGGSTPRATYQSLIGRVVGWDKVWAYLSDERWVPADSERSNGKMAQEALFDRVEGHFIRPRYGNHLTPADSAAYYEAKVRSIHHGDRPDLILLGLGEDGHTASLFPESRALEERNRWIVANQVTDTGEQRITATYPMLWSAHRLVVITVGTNKAAALRDAFDGANPAGLLGDGDALVEWHVDRAAASLYS